MIAELDMSNALIAKYMIEYQQAEADLSLEEKRELITELIKYQRNLAEIKKYQTQQSKPSTKTEKRNFYMAILKSHAGWKKSERVKRPGIQLAQESSKRLKTTKASGSDPTDPTEDKEKELWVELKRLYEPDPRDQLWALQRYMHDPLEWRLYDTCGVHHVSTERGHEIFMLVEKDYPLTKGLTTLLLCNKLQVDQYSEMANELLIKIYSIANSPR
ncbi:hypothetical protein Tco_0999891 [Tanacetum coccineum]